MANLSGITAVRPTQTTRIGIVRYGATIAAGEAVFQNTDGKFLLADADLSAAAAAAQGIAMTPGVDNGFGVVAFEGPIILVGTTMTVGETYLVSRTAGAIMPTGDKQAGDKVTQLGVAATATQLNLFIRATGVLVL